MAALLALLLSLAGLAVVQRSGAVRSHQPLAGGAGVVPPPTTPSSAAGSATTAGGTGSAGTTSPSGSPPGPSGATSGAPGTGTSAPTTPSTGPVPPVPGPAFAVGDSIMIDIQPYLEADLPGVRVDGQVSRQFEAGIAVVQAARAAGTLGNVLVVELGTNGTVTPSDVDAMMQAAAGVRRVVFVNVDVPRPWTAPDNAVLAAGVARYPGVAVLADWYSLASGHPEWFTPDEVHLQPAGAQAMAALIAADA